MARRIAYVRCLSGFWAPQTPCVLSKLQKSASSADQMFGRSIFEVRMGTADRRLQRMFSVQAASVKPCLVSAILS